MMPENENTSPVSPPAPPVAAKPSLWLPLLLLIALLALLLAGWQWWETRQKLDASRQEMALRLSEMDASRQAMQKQWQEQLGALQSRLATVDGKLSELDSLQSLAQDITRSREEATLIEVEQAITLASQQLQLAGNVPVAILALQAADARLARLDQPAYLPLRKAVSKDLERLSALPFVDVPGISLRLEQLVLGADKWPLASLVRPAAQAEAAPLGAEQPKWQRLADSVWHELQGLVRIQRFDREDTALLAPGQAFFLRENIKLRLLNARLALLSHDQSILRSELKAAQLWLGKYFDDDDKSVQLALASLRQMSAADLNVELPNLNDSQAALRSLRGSKEKR